MPLSDKEVRMAAFAVMNELPPMTLADQLKVLDEARELAFYTFEGRFPRDGNRDASSSDS
jgi:hypothetical protein